MMHRVQDACLRAAESGAYSGLLRLFESLDRRPDLLRVLTYHRIAYPDSHPGLGEGLLSAYPEEFARQMEWLAGRCRLVSMAELLTAVRKRKPLPRRAVLLTFDDAYVDFAEHAWPVLKRLGLPVTLFVPTAYPDRPELAFWWDRLRAAFLGAAEAGSVLTPLGLIPLKTPEQRWEGYARLNDWLKTRSHTEAMERVDELAGTLKAAPLGQTVLGWDTLRTLSFEGVTLAPHTRTHPLMSRITPDEARSEATGSLEDLRREIGEVLPVFAYPSGAVAQAASGVLRDEGFELAFTTAAGVNDLHRLDPMHLRRVGVNRRTRLPVLRTRLLPWASRIKR